MQDYIIYKGSIGSWWNGNTTDSDSGDWGFDSYYPSNIGMYISWLDSHPDKVEVIGSSPIIPTVIVAQWVEQQVMVLLVVSSNPIYHPISS